MVTPTPFEFFNFIPLLDMTSATMHVNLVFLWMNSAMKLLMNRVVWVNVCALRDHVLAMKLLHAKSKRLR
jgi:hypothetical protein